MKQDTSIALAAAAGLGLFLLIASSGEAAAAEPPTPEPPAPPPPEPPAPPPPEPVSDINQATIANAIWASVDKGDTTELKKIAREAKNLPPALRAYLVAAGRRGSEVYRDIQTFIRDFNRREGLRAEERESKEKTEAAAIGTTAAVVTGVAAAAAAANAVPVVGQIVSALLAIGLALYYGIRKGIPAPQRRGEEQILPGYEGVGIFKGLSFNDPNNTRQAAIRQEVQMDPVADQLPLLAGRVAFPFVPSLDEYRKAAHELKLYPGDK